MNVPPVKSTVVGFVLPIVTPLNTGLTMLSPFAHFTIYGLPASIAVRSSLKFSVSLPSPSRFDVVSSSFTVAPSSGVSVKSLTANGRHSVFHAPSL